MKMKTKKTWMKMIVDIFGRAFSGQWFLLAAGLATFSRQEFGKLFQPVVDIVDMAANNDIRRTVLLSAESFKTIAAAQASHTVMNSVLGPKPSALPRLPYMEAVTLHMTMIGKTVNM